MQWILRWQKCCHPLPCLAALCAVLLTPHAVSGHAGPAGWLRAGACIVLAAVCSCIGASQMAVVCVLAHLCIATLLSVSMWLECAWCAAVSTEYWC